MFVDKTKKNEFPGTSSVDLVCAAGNFHIIGIIGSDSVAMMRGG